jgi:hypothetical protein
LSRGSQPPPALKTSGQLNNSWPTLTCGHPIFHCGPLWDRGVVIPPLRAIRTGAVSQRNRARARSARRRRRAGARRVGSRSSPNAQNTRPRCPSRTSEHQFRFFGVKLKILHPCTSTALSSASYVTSCARIFVRIELNPRVFSVSILMLRHAPVTLSVPLLPRIVYIVPRRAVLPF